MACPPTRILWAVPSSRPRPHPASANRRENATEAVDLEPRICCAISRALRLATAGSSRSKSGRRASTRMCWNVSWMRTSLFPGAPRWPRTHPADSINFWRRRQVELVRSLDPWPPRPPGDRRASVWRSWRRWMWPPSISRSKRSKDAQGLWVFYHCDVRKVERQFWTFLV